MLLGLFGETDGFLLVKDRWLLLYLRLGCQHNFVAQTLKAIDHGSSVRHNPRRSRYRWWRRLGLNR